MKKLIKTTNKEINDLDKDLTFKQKAFLKRYFETGNGVLAASEVYKTSSYQSAGAIASETLKKLKNPIREYMESKGLSLGLLVEKVREGLDATKTTNAAILITKDGKIEKAEEQGLIETPDYLTRHRYIESVSKWLGIEKEKEELTPPTANVQVNIHPEFIKKYGNV